MAKIDDPLHTVLREDVVVDKRIPGDHVHVEALRAARDAARNVAESHQPEHLVGQLGHGHQVLTRIAPAILADTAIERHGLFGAAQQQHHGVVGDFVQKDVWHVGDHDALRRRCVQIDAIDTDAAIGDHLAAVQLADDLSRQAPAARDDRVGIFDRRDVVSVTVGIDSADRDPERP